jgi:hypothetical protein
MNANNQNLAVAIENKIDRGVTGAMTIRSNGPSVPVFANMGEVLEFAKIMAVSQVAVRKHLRNNPGACAAICMQAQRWEMDPFMVANKSYEVNDQIAFESQLIAAVVNTRAPIKGRLKTRFTGEGPNRRCVAYATFIGEDEPTEVESPVISSINPKNSPLWKTDPDQQLSYYTKRLWARREAPEVLLGVYDVDEIGPGTGVAADGIKDVTPARPKRSDFIDSDGVVVESQTQTTENEEIVKDKAWALRCIADSQTVEWAMEVWSQMPDELADDAEIFAAYEARRDELAGLAE